MDSASQPELPVDTLSKKTSTMDRSLRSLRSNTSLASQTYADLSLLANSDDSSLSESINLEKASRFRKKRSKPLESASQPELHSNANAKKPPKGKKAAEKMETSLLLRSDKTYGNISDSLLESSNDSINLEAARNMRHRNRREKVVLSQPNPNLPPLITPKKGKGSSHKNMSPKWKSPESFASPRGKGKERMADSPVPMPSTQPASHLDNTYDLDANADESLENVKAATRQRFGRKAPPVKLNLSALVKNLKKSQQETVEDEEEEEKEKKQLAESESIALHYSSSEKSDDDQDSQASLDSRVIPETQDQDNQASQNIRMIPETQDQDDQASETIRMIPETQELGMEGQGVVDASNSDSSDTEDFYLGKQVEGVVKSIPETQESNASAGDGFKTGELTEKEEEFADPLSPPLTFRDTDEEQQNKEESETDHLSPVPNSDEDNTFAAIFALEKSPARDRSSARVSDIASSPLHKNKIKDSDKANSSQKSLKTDIKLSGRSLESPVRTGNENQFGVRSSLGETSEVPSSPRSVATRKSLSTSYSGRVASMESRSPRKSVGMLPVKDRSGTDLHSGSPWKYFEMKNAHVQLKRLEEDQTTPLSLAKASTLGMQSSKGTSSRTPVRDSGELAPPGTPGPEVSKSKEVLSEEGRSKMAAQRARMHTVTIEAEVHPEEAIKAATRASPGMLADADSQEEQESVGNISDELDDGLASHKSQAKSMSSVLSQNADAVYIPVEADFEEPDGVTSNAESNSGEGDDLNSLKEDLEEIVSQKTRLVSSKGREEVSEAAAFGDVELMGKESQAQRSNVALLDLSPAATASQTDESDEEEEFLLPTLLRRKSVMPEVEPERPDESLEAPNDISMGEVSEVSIRQPDLEESQAAINKQMQRTSMTDDHISNISKAKPATIAPTAKQMTMKEFLQKLAEKPMQSPVPTKQKGPRLASLLKYTKPQTPKKVSLKRPRGVKNQKKELPKMLSKASTRDLFSHFAKCRLTPDGLEQLLKVSEEYWKNCCSDLVNFVDARRGVKEVQAKDVKKLMKRQGLASSEEDLQILVQKFLPVEEWNHLIPTAFAKGNIHPLPPDS